MLQLPPCTPPALRSMACNSAAIFSLASCFLHASDLIRDEKLVMVPQGIRAQAPVRGTPLEGTPLNLESGVPLEKWSMAKCVRAQYFKFLIEFPLCLLFCVLCAAAACASGRQRTRTSGCDVLHDDD